MRYACHERHVGRYVIRFTGEGASLENLAGQLTVGDLVPTGVFGSPSVTVNRVMTSIEFANYFEFAQQHHSANGYLDEVAYLP